MNTNPHKMMGLPPRHAPWALAIALATGLAGCGGNDELPNVAVDELGAGTYVVSVGAAESPTVGRYYAGSDGSRLLVLEDADARAQQSYRRAAGGAWLAVPAAAQNATLSLLHNAPVAPAALSAGALAGHYVAQLAAGEVVDFTLAANGAISAGASACKLTGQAGAGGLPDTLQVELTTSGCTALPGRLAGVLVADADHRPARFRLIADNGAQLFDLWAYAE